MKKTLAYVNPDCFFDTDLNVLKFLAAEYRVIWYPVYYTDRRVYYTPDELQSYADKYEIEIHHCPRQYRQRDPKNLGFYSRIVQDINDRKVDIIFSCIAEELYWTLACFKLHSTRVFGLHDVLLHDFGKPTKRAVQTLIRNFTIRSSRHICVFSENQRELFSKRYGREAFVLGLSCKCFGEPSAKAPDITDGVKLLFFGNIVQYKGLDLLIDAMEQLRDKGFSNLHLTIAGQGEFWTECERHIKTPRMYDLKIRFIENDEIPDLVASHHFMALPYRNATQSGPQMIAAGGGMPILAPGFGCFKELYDERSAILYPDLLEALRRISKMTNKEYSIMKDNAKQLARLHSEESVAARYIHYFKSLFT